MGIRRTFRIAVGLAVAMALGYLLAWPAPIDPEAWTPPPAPPLAGPYAPNERLAALERIAFDDGGVGPEAIAIDRHGRLYTGLADGRIVRIEFDHQATTFARTGGRPLGMKFDAEGRLVVADARRGLLRYDADGRETVLDAGRGAVPFRFADDVAITPDGKIYFTDASRRFGLDQWKLDLLEHRPNGRLLVYDPANGRTEVVAGGFYFANGLTLSPDGSFLALCETGRYRILRHWLTGPRRGATEPLVENLPGFCDNVTTSPRGFFWVALGSPRKRELDWLLPRPFWRKIVARLPQALQPGPTRRSFVLGVDAEGRVVENLQATGPGAYAPITSAIEHEGRLYLGSLSEPSIAVHTLGE